MQRTWLLTFNLWHKKIREYKTLIHTFTKWIEDKTNNNNINNDNNKIKKKIKNMNLKDPIKVMR